MLSWIFLGCEVEHSNSPTEYLEYWQSHLLLETGEVGTIPLPYISVPHIFSRTNTS